MGHWIMIVERTPADGVVRAEKFVGSNVSVSYDGQLNVHFYKDNSQRIDIRLDPSTSDEICRICRDVLKE